MTGMTAKEHAAIRERGEAVGRPVVGRVPDLRALRVRTATSAWGRMTLDASSGRGFHGAPATAWSWRPRTATVRDEVRARSRDVARPAGGRDQARADPVRRGPGPGGERPGTGRWKGFLALRRDAGGAVDGLRPLQGPSARGMRTTRGRDRRGSDELYGLTDEAYAALWRYLGEMDLRGHGEGRWADPLDERLPWLLTNARAARMTRPRRRSLGPAVRRAAGPRGAHLGDGREPGAGGGGRWRRRRPVAACPGRGS